MSETIETYHAALSENDQLIVQQLRALIDSTLPEAESKIWHRHPVWFINGNPVVGYSKLKKDVRLLFWSGQSFDEPSLQAEGSFKAAEMRFLNPTDIHVESVVRCLEKSRALQWDYKNIVKRNGVLIRLEI